MSASNAIAGWVLNLSSEQIEAHIADATVAAPDESNTGRAYREDKLEWLLAERDRREAARRSQREVQDAG